MEENGIRKTTPEERERIKEERKPFEAYTSKELLQIGMKYWGDNDTQAYIEWCCRRRGKTCFKAGIAIGIVLTLFVQSLILLLSQ